LLWLKKIPAEPVRAKNFRADHIHTKIFPEKPGATKNIFAGPGPQQIFLSGPCSQTPAAPPPHPQALPSGYQQLTMGTSLPGDPVRRHLRR